MKTKTLNLANDCQPSIDLLSLRAITFGNSGAGKTGLGRVLFEESVASGVPTGVIDLKGDWWGLKSSKSGNSDGLQVIIFGGDHADVPINENAGAEIADIVVELGHNFIIDLEAFSKAKQLKFLAAFMDRLYDNFFPDMDRKTSMEHVIAHARRVSADPHECQQAVLRLIREMEAMVEPEAKMPRFKTLMNAVWVSITNEG